MKLDALAKQIGASIVTGFQPNRIEIERFYADDKISELLTEAGSKTLVLSGVINPHIIRVAELIDVPAICLLDNSTPEPEMLNAAAERGTALLISPFDRVGTLKRLYQCLGLEARLRHESSALYD